MVYTIPNYDISKGDFSIMSQAKVNKYKEQKANRKQLMKQEKRSRAIRNLVGAVLGLALIGWIGYSAYDSITTKIQTSQTEVELSAVTDYISDLTATETDAE